MPQQSKSCAIWVRTECVFPRVLLCRPVFDFATKPITGIEVPTNQPLCVFLIVLAVWYPELVPSFRSKVSFITFWIASFQCMVDTQKDSGREKNWFHLDETESWFDLHFASSRDTESLFHSMGPKSKLMFLKIVSNILMSCSSKPWCMHLGRILAVKGIKVGDVITKSGAQCEKHKRWGQSVKFTEKVEPVRSGEPRRSSGSQSSVRSCSGE